MNTRNTLEIKLLAMILVFVALLMPMSIFAQKSPKEPKKQIEQKDESGKQKVEKEPKEQKAESGKQKVEKELKESKAEKEPKVENKKQKDETEQTKPKEQKEKAKKQKFTDATYIAIDEVPIAVMKAYKKRYASAADPAWNFYKKEQIYKVTCVYRGITSQISFTSEGVWIETTEELPVDKLNSACIKTINMYYKDYKVNSLKKLTTSDKNDMFIVGVFENKNIKKKLETKIYLELSGAYIKAEDPVDATEDKIVVTETEQTDKKQEKQEKEEKRLRKKFEKEMHIDEDAPIRLDGNELPPSVQNWVLKNYPEYIYKDVTYGEYDGFENEGRIYQIVIQRTGINQPHATIWFTRDGNFLKLEDNFKEEMQEEIAAENQNESAKEKNTKENEKKTVKESSPKDEPAGYSVEEEDVKAEVMTAFKTKYPRAKNVSWEENEGVEWIVAFTDQYGQNTAIFSDNLNEWIYTKTLLPDVNKIPAAIRNYIIKNYPKKQLMKGWVIKSPDAKPYYTVELYTKKGKLTEHIDFLQNGKLKE